MPRGVYIRSKETKIKMSKSQKGRIVSEETRIKISKGNKGKKLGPLSKEHRKKLSESMIKKTNSEEYRKKISDEKASSWKGGNTRYYHKLVKNKYEKNYCQKCGISKLLSLKVFYRNFSMHCVDKNFKNVVSHNWITLCVSCHCRLHKTLK
jgi:hypothetical protein